MGWNEEVVATQLVEGGGREGRERSKRRDEGEELKKSKGKCQRAKWEEEEEEEEGRGKSDTLTLKSSKRTKGESRVAEKKN